MATARLSFDEALTVLRLDGLALEVAKRLESAAIRCVLLKGPVTTTWLYGDVGARRYRDVDLLVHPSEFGPALELLVGMGFVDGQPHTLRVHMGYHERHLIRAGLCVDLHRGIAGMPRQLADRAVRQLLDSRVPFDLAGDKVFVLEPTARVAHLAWHVAQSRGNHQEIADLERGLNCVSQDQWRSASDLSTQVGLGGAFKLGLSAIPHGRVLIESLPAGPKPPPLVRLASSGATQETLAILRIADAPRGERFCELRRWFSFGAEGIPSDVPPMSRASRVRLRLVTAVRLVFRSCELLIQLPSLRRSSGLTD